MILEDRPPQPMPEATMAMQKECAKEASGRDASYIDRNPDKQVVLSPRLEQLARQVGGCQTEEVLALVRRIMFEVISQRKY
jgi:hypothetical protein